MNVLQRELPTGDTSVVPIGRALIADWLPDSMPTEVLADAQLAASELLANAVAVARGCIRIEVHLEVGCVRIAVYDDGPGQPQAGNADALATSGRGLAIVAIVSVAWGIRRDPPGKWVWAELALDAA